MAKKTPTSETRQPESKSADAPIKNAGLPTSEPEKPLQENAEQAPAKAKPAGTEPAPKAKSAISNAAKPTEQKVSSETSKIAAEPAPTKPARPVAPLEKTPPSVSPQPEEKATGAGSASPSKPKMFSDETAFIASMPPLPVETDESEFAMRELLRDVEEQFELIMGASEAIAEDERVGTVASEPIAAEPSAKLKPEPEAEPAPESVPEACYAPEPEHHDHGYQIPRMYIVQITPELSPVAKVGGLADVVFGLSNELEIRGNSVEIILPKYDCLRYDQIWGLCETYNDLFVPWYGGAIHCTVFFGFVHGRKCFFIEPHSGDNFFNRGSIYGFNDDVMRFAFFTRAALEFLWKSGKQPEVIHCHDWQTALAPVFLYEIYQHLGLRHPRVCFTIHNFKHQGVTGAHLLHATGLNRPEHFYHYDRMRDNHNPRALNLMKAGVVYSNFVTTVSPRHAFEAKDQGQGFGLEPTLHIHHNKYGGVVNGIDYSVWNPEIDPLIPVHYNADSIDGKYDNKRALRHRLMLADNEKPVVAFVGRLDPQKGLELIRHAIFYTLHRGGQFVLLGSSPEAQINNYFWGLKHQLNENPDCHIEVGYNEELAHLIYAGSDLMIVPSRFEPCGLTQLIAMRYGSVPVVREVGGLVDTVFDKDFSWRPLHERNGYVFRDYNEPGLESALGRAISCYYEFPEHFRDTIGNAMRSDYSWNRPGHDYLNIYDYIREK